MGQSHTKQAAEEHITPSTSSSSIASHTFKAKKYLTRIELVSLKYIFEQLESNFADGFACIEPKRFLEHLDLPIEVEPAGVLLFKSFSFLGSYPSCTAVGPVPLSFEAFITAYAILVGKLDDTSHPNLSEQLFFQALSILPSPSKEVNGEEPVIVEHPVEEEEPSNHEGNLPRGLSLADLGVDFSDMDFDATPSKDSDSDDEIEHGSEILCRDLIELFVLLLWLGEADQQKHDFDSIREMAVFIVNSMKPVTELSATEKDNEDVEAIPCISQLTIHHWKENFSPHLFKPVQSFITKAFGYCTPGNTALADSRLLAEDKVPKADKTDVLNAMHSTLLSWTLPQEILVLKEWSRLYSADQNGFSMNRFESHVFKYPGPTLFVIQVDAIESNRATLARTSPKERTWSTSSLDLKKNEAKHQSMILGAYITQPWKHSKQFWGTNECFLFELDPRFDVFRPVMNKRTGEPKNNHYVYYHHEFGIGIGPTDSHIPQHNQQHDHHGFILSLKSTLQEGIYENEAYPSNPSFQSATKSTRNKSFFYKFETENIEVFGLGSDKAREKQAKEWKFERQEADRRAGLNIRKEDGQLDKELLKMAGIIDEDKRQDR